MASGKINVFATTTETSLPVLFTKIKKEWYEMAVTDVFSKGIYIISHPLRPLQTSANPSISAPLCPPTAFRGHMLLVGLELKWCEYEVRRLMYVFQTYICTCARTDTENTEYIHSGE